LSVDGLRVSKVSGLYDFPGIKNEGTDWTDEDYTEVLNRLIDFQYESRKITLECYCYAASWADLDAMMLDLIGWLDYDGLKMLIMTEYSNRGYMVRLNKSTIFNPYRYFEAGQSVAKFTIVFEEPQPFNVQFSFFYPDDKFEQLIEVNVSKTSKSLSLGSTEQQFATVHFMEDSTEVNLEQEDFDYSELYPVVELLPYPLIITGDVDAVEDITIGATVAPIGVAVAELFLRNGTITIL